MKILIDANARIDQLTGGGLTLLEASVANMRMEAIDLLLQHHADPNQLSSDNKTAMYYALNPDYQLFFNGKTNVNIISMLLNATTEVNQIIDGQNTLLQAASCKGLQHVVLTLLRANADANKVGLSAERHVLEQSPTTLVSSSKQQLANNVFVDPNGETLLHKAVTEGQTEIVRLLVREKANVNAPNKYGTTPLMAASNPTIFEILYMADQGMIKISQKSEYTLIASQTNLDVKTLEKNASELCPCIYANASQTQLSEPCAYTCQKTLCSICYQTSNCNVKHLHLSGLTKISELAVSCPARIKRSSILHVYARNGFKNLSLIALRLNADVNAESEVNEKLPEDGSTPLSVACESGHYGIASSLLQYNAIVDTNDNEGATPLFKAAFKGFDKIVALLLRVHADVDKANEVKKIDVGADKIGQTPLYVAAQNGHVRVISQLLGAGAQINKQTMNGYTALMIAAKNGHYSATEKLVKEKADINHTNTDGLTSLFLAVKGQHIKIVQILINANADVNRANKDGNTPLILAAQNGYVDCVTALLQANADKNIPNRLGNTPVIVAKEKCIIDILNNYKGGTLLQHACGTNYHNMVLALLQANADPNKVGSVRREKAATLDSCITRKQPNCLLDKETPLFAAVSNNHATTVSILIQANANITIANKNGATPLIVASENGYYRIASSLIQYNADVNTTDKSGGTPMFISAWNGFDKIVALLLRANGDVNHANYSGQTPLYIAAQYGHIKVVSLLLDANAIVDKETINGYTALLIASQSGHCSIVERLLRHKVDINHASSDGSTPLLLAVKQQHSNIVHMLVDENADVNRANKDGITPIFVAVQNGDINVVSKLLHAKPDIDTPNKFGTIPMMVAKEKSVVDILKAYKEREKSGDVCDQEEHNKMYI
ncbi:hypothetical protein THRCLA_10456 [Thraustotheca clavata]|uniref:Uncharacterized protein n=1 Tax=Thraustotheca clavata TaxID=74557 RepID=A0A1V9YP08_9STRA|nr:hypothetical protein THRCLA_10456 [Thraustotheca clavata]